MVHYGFLGVQDAPKAPKMPPNSSKINKNASLLVWKVGNDIYII